MSRGSERSSFSVLHAYSTLADRVLANPRLYRFRAPLIAALSVRSLCLDRLLQHCVLRHSDHSAPKRRDRLCRGVYLLHVRPATASELADYKRPWPMV